jgi:hypothetical protein
LDKALRLRYDLFCKGHANHTGSLLLNMRPEVKVAQKVDFSPTARILKVELGLAQTAR